MRASSLIFTIASLAVAAGTADAQGRGRGRGNEKIPPGHLPPAGMCRIWMNGVPPGHQPAPTSCESAVRNQPPNSRILWGENTNRDRVIANVRRDDHDRDDDRDYDRAHERRGRNRNDRDRNDRDAGTYRRDAHGHEYDPTCIDNDRDGWCDYHRDVRSGVHVSGTAGNPTSGGGTTTPVDRGQYPSQLPAMTGATLIRVGVRTVDVQNWLGRGDLRAETVDDNGDGVPERATWYDGQGTILQVWRDDDRDGRADSVEVYRNGQRVQVVR